MKSLNIIISLLGKSVLYFSLYRQRNRNNDLSGKQGKVLLNNDNNNNLNSNILVRFFRNYLQTTYNL